MRIFMATRNDNDQNKVADEAARTARTVTDEAARVGEQTARASADLANRGTEAARNAVEAGLNTATQTFQRFTDQFTKVLGFNGPQSEELTRPPAASSSLARSRTRMWPRMALISPVASRVCTAIVTPERRTPSIMDRNSWTRGRSSPSTRSWHISSQRARRSSMV